MAITDSLQPVFVLTGAGISAESGVPTFRGSAGLWENHRAQDLATPTAYARNPELVWRFYAWRRQLVSGCEPNRAHSILVEIERELPDFTLVTQNVDGLHQRAGSRAVIELHGSLWQLRCPACQELWQDLTVPLDPLPPNCPNCGSIARPDVVWFGEHLDPNLLGQAKRAASRAATVLVIGTSSMVQPAAGLALVAKQAGASIVEFNLVETPLSPLADEVRLGAASNQLKAWWDGHRQQ
ncbi:MAG: NAD-dependent deacylase [Anaerolineales bacterium]